MRLIQYTVYGYMRLLLARFKCHEEISDSPTTRFCVTLYRRFGEHLESSFRKRRPMDDNAHARCTHKRKFYAHLEPIRSRQTKKVSTHSLVSASHQILSIFGAQYSGSLYSYLLAFSGAVGFIHSWTYL